MHYNEILLNNKSVYAWLVTLECLFEQYLEAMNTGCTKKISVKKHLLIEQIQEAT
jgi:hypothetical protein